MGDEPPEQADEAWPKRVDGEVAVYGVALLPPLFEGHELDLAALPVHLSRVEEQSLPHARAGHDQELGELPEHRRVLGHRDRLQVNIDVVLFEPELLASRGRKPATVLDRVLFDELEAQGVFEDLVEAGQFAVDRPRRRLLPGRKPPRSGVQREFGEALAPDGDHSVGHADLLVVLPIGSLDSMHGHVTEVARQRFHGDPVGLVDARLLRRFGEQRQVVVVGEIVKRDGRLAGTQVRVEIGKRSAFEEVDQVGAVDGAPDPPSLEGEVELELPVDLSDLH